ncbi:YtzH-like family protein [Bacillus massiliglaciei]|uniref:YtzH-like family protein n=1 Tax=Bacillus massiliglaciei TaxID=1816693 RepID=UPI000DA62E80|nr:YtzH-like family protein [Bacillus massiliglaciei]
MPLNSQYQISLLKDILSNQQTDCCGSVAEYEQVERLIKSLMVNMDLNDQARSMLQEIYHYSQQGRNSGDIDAHITSNQGNITQWMSDIGQLQ